MPSTTPLASAADAKRTTSILAGLPGAIVETVCVPPPKFWKILCLALNGKVLVTARIAPVVQPVHTVASSSGDVRGHAMYPIVKCSNKKYGDGNGSHRLQSQM